MKKKILAGILITVMACAVPVYADEAPPVKNIGKEVRSGDFTAEILNDDTVVITHVESGEEKCAGIPAEIDGRPVSAIGERAFEYMAFDDLTIPDTVTRIDKRAFEYITVNGTFSLPENIQILEDAFGYAELPDELTIPKGAFLDVDTFSNIYGAETIVIGDGAVIGSDAFSYAEDVKSVTVGANTEIGERAFSYCDNLESVSVGEGAAVDDRAFEYCPKLKQIGTAGSADSPSGNGADSIPGDTTEQNADTLADWNIKVVVPEGAEAVLDGTDNCYYIYPQEADSIPYVLLTTYEYDSVDDFIPDFTKYMESVYEDLEVTAEPVEKTIGSKECTEIDYGYTVSGYDVLDRRIVTVSEGTVYMFASKEIPELDLMIGNMLEDVVAGSVFLTEDGEPIENIPSKTENDSISLPGKDEPSTPENTTSSTPSDTPAPTGAFSDFYDYENPDGTYSYYFMQGVFVTMNKDWYQKTMVIPDEHGATFYHKASYYAWQEQGLTGGRLFTISASVNTDFQNLPSFEYIGFDEEEVMNYFAILPTDYQAYADDESIRSEYDSLWAGVKDVIAGITLE